MSVNKRGACNAPLHIIYVSVGHAIRAHPLTPQKYYFFFFAAFLSAAFMFISIFLKFLMNS